MSSNDHPILRWDPLITRTSGKWTNQVSIFKLLLGIFSAEALDSILSGCFTPSERELAPLRHILCPLPTFVEDNAVTRLTMLYFGPPAEPIMPDMFRALNADVEMLDGAGCVGLQGIEAPLSSIPATQAHATTLNLGRQVEELKDPALRSSLRGGGEPENLQPGLQFMCGFQGRIGFRAEMDDGIIEGTVRRLLGIAEHEKDAEPKHRIVITHLDVGRLNGNVGPDGHTNPILSSWTGQYPLDPAQIMMDIVTHGKNTSDHSDCCMWFVRYENEDLPAAWRPSLEERKRMITLAREGVPDELAYFLLPESVGRTFIRDTGKNMYSAYMRTAMEVLLGRMNQPGDNHCSVLVHDKEEEPSKDEQCCYGGLELPQKVYEKLYPSIGRATPWTVKVSAFDAEVIALCLTGYEQVPSMSGTIRGNFQVLPLKDIASAWKYVYEMLDKYLSEDMKKRPLRVGLAPTYDLFEGRHPHRETLSAHPFDYIHADCKGHHGLRAWADELTKYLLSRFEMGHRAFNIFVGLQERYKLVPNWVKGITPEDYDDVATTFDPNTIRSLRRAVQILLKNHPDLSIKYTDCSSLYITLESISMSGSCPAARVVITPTTTMVDFTRAITQLMSSKFLVSVSSGKDVDFAKAVQETAIQWGPRYGDVAVFAYNVTEDDDTDNDSATSIYGNTRPESEAKPEKPSPASSGVTASAPECGRSPPTSLQQPSVFDDSPSPSSPMGGPPKEPHLRAGGPGVRMVAERVQTPMKKQRVIDALYTARNKMLGRSITCNYKGCSFTVRADDANGMQRHLQVEHVATRCPWCSTELFAHMSQVDKEKHIAEQHGDKVRNIAQEYPGQVYGRRAKGKGHKNLSKEERELIEMATRRLDVRRPQPRLDTRIPRAPERASHQEVVYNFCDRCGRDHTQFSDDERNRHDKICVPRAPHEGDASWCQICGAKVWRTRDLSRQQEGDHVRWPHSCDPEGDEDHGPFCSKCGYPLGDLKDSNNTHAQNCKGFSGKMAQFCPYCGVPMGYIRDHHLREKHIISCPDQGDNGADLTSAEGTPYSMYATCMTNERGPRQEDDQFYMGWREDLRPGTWAPNGGDPARTISGDMASELARAQKEAKERIAPRKRAEEALSEPDGGRTRGAARAAMVSEEDEVEEDEVEEAPTAKTAKKRPAEAGRNPVRKRQKTAPQTEEPAPHATKRPHPMEEPATPEMKTPQATEKPAAPATEPSQPESVPSPPEQQPEQSSGERGQAMLAPAQPSGREGSRRKRLPFSRPSDATPSPPKKKPATKMVDKGRQLAPPAPTSTEGDEDPNFTPSAGMWCSRCFRKKPTGKVGKLSQDPSYIEQMERHMDPEGSCRIRRARGKVSTEPITYGEGLPKNGIGLPNNSGWMLDKDVKAYGSGLTAGKIKAAFKKEYPNYALTIYPIGESQATQSVWKNDPNSRPGIIEISKALPMPPDKNATAVRTKEGKSLVAESGGPKKEGGGKAKSKKVSPNKTNQKKNEDKMYRDSGKQESEDDEPEPEAVRNDYLQDGPRKKRKRKPAKAGPSTTAEPTTTNPQLAKQGTLAAGCVVSILALTFFSRPVRADHYCSLEQHDDGRDPSLPRFRLSEVKKHDGCSPNPWVAYEDKVYDITEWVPAHPGGEVILRAAGGSIDPYWDIFAIHKQPYVREILDSYLIGYVDAADLVNGRIPQDDIEDPFANDPQRHPGLIVLTRKPCNAETPGEALADHFITPTEQFYVRNHMWVPKVEGSGADHAVTIELPDGDTKTYTLRQLREKFRTYKVTATLQCSGNRRKHMTTEGLRTNGLQWNVGGISCAEWEGVRLADVLADAGFPVRAAQAGEETEAKHVWFSGLEAYGSSIPLATAVDPRADVLLAYGMNGKSLPKDHGFPLRALVPGTVAARSVKWLSKITLSDEESPAQWQRRDYKSFGPNEVGREDWESAAAIQEMPVTSSITSVDVRGKEKPATVRGYAYSGGGRKIVRVDISLDNGQTWDQAELIDDCALRKGESESRCKGRKRWAWQRWRYEGALPMNEEQGGKKCSTIVVKATDESYNAQPERNAGIYNLRGNLATAWHRVVVCNECKKEDHKQRGKKGGGLNA